MDSGSEYEDPEYEDPEYEAEEEPPAPVPLYPFTDLLPIPMGQEQSNEGSIVPTTHEYVYFISVQYRLTCIYLSRMSPAERHILRQLLGSRNPTIDMIQTASHVTSSSGRSRSSEQHTTVQPVYVSVSVHAY